MSFLAKLLEQPTTTMVADKTAFNFIVRNLQAMPFERSGAGNDAFDASLLPEPCEHFDELVAALQQKLKLSPSAIDCLQIMMAVSISLNIHGPFLWTHCVGPSSSLKTTLASLIAAAQDRAFMISNFSGFTSGFRGANGADTSIVPHLQGRTVIIPDLTPLLTSDSQHQKEIFGQFRDIYEGKFNRFYNNGVQRRYDSIRFSCITCVTDVIYKFSHSDLGERFLMCEIDGQWIEGKFVRESVDTKTSGNAFSSTLMGIASGFDSDETPSLDSLAKERAMCWGLINHLNTWISDEGSNLSLLAKSMAADPTFKDEIESLATWMEYARHPVPKKGDDVNHSSRPALPHRSIRQLTKSAICLCIVSKTTTLTANIRRLIRKLAFDTCHLKTLEIMNWLACHPSYPKEILANVLNLSPTWVAHLCHHLQSLGVIRQEFRDNNSGNRGRNMLCYSLTPEFTHHAKVIGLSPKAEIPDSPSAAPLFKSTKSLKDLLKKGPA